MKRFLALLFVIAAALLFASAGFAAEPNGNDRKGKYTYRKIYKECNQSGKIDSPKPLSNPDSKTRAQWGRIFDKKDWKELGCEEAWQNLSEEELTNVFTYLYEHAADSPSPAKCN